MKLKEYFSHLAILARAYPDARVVYSCDDEGNVFSPVYYHPSKGVMVDETEFNAIKSYKKGMKVDTVCIN